MGFWSSVGDYLFGNNDQRNEALDPKNFQLQGADYLRQHAMSQMNGAQGRPAPTAQAAQLGAAAQLAGGPQNQWRAQQMGLAGQLAGVAGGQQMGAGELAVRRQANQQAAQLTGAASMARGSNAGIMARAAARGLGDLGVNAAGAASQSALQDQANARSALAGVLGQGRGQDLDLASQNAQLAQQRMMQQGMFNQQTGLANQQAALAQRGMNDQYSLGLMGQYAGISEAELRARMARAGVLPQDNGQFGNIMSAAGPILAAFSDRNAKHSIKEASDDADEFMDSLTPYSFRYKDESHGAGERLGVMAQDVEESHLGRNIVTEVDGIKAIDHSGAISALLAGVARLNARVSELELELRARGAE